MKFKLALLLAALAFTACAHQYSYIPEVEGDGATHAPAAVIYAIPANHPVFKMQVVSLGMGVPKQKNENDPKVEMLQIRLFFQRTKPTACDRIAFVPNEQTIQFTDGTTLRPSVIHATSESLNDSKKQKNKIEQRLIQFSCKPNQAVELFYALPKKKDQPAEVQSFQFAWKMHYQKSKVEQQVSRFDRQDSRSQNSVDAATFKNDQFYPYDTLLPIGSEWIGNDWYYMSPVSIQPSF